MEEASNMIVDVTDKEIKASMFDIDNKKALGPDGFSSCFFKKAWEFIRQDVCNAIKEFSIMENYLVKIKDGLTKIVSCNHSAFVPGRHIQDNILITQELLRGYNRRQRAKRDWKQFESLNEEAAVTEVQDYALWEVIEKGNSFKHVPRTTANADGTSTSTIPGPVTTEEKAEKMI
ncbi:hypothetical protein Tco_1054082 [Tanacetum coccineum]|uniref:Reverse transcriptase domain-containing protein n=1 Tax=Tanacetum coccineum TaxID=301880 RepID=A0ABQ5GXA4_9ASTR